MSETETGKGKTMIERAYDRFMLVCHKSGVRRRGLEKRLFETKNFLNVLNEVDYKHGIFHEMEWIKDDVRNIHEFFHLINECCFTIKSDDYFSKAMVIAALISLSGKEGEKLKELQNKNRLHLIVIKSIPVLSKRIGFAESWIEDNELFFEDMKDALSEIFHFEKQTEDKIPWVGNDLRVLRLFKSGL